MGAYAREEIEAIYRRQFKLVYQICLVLMKSVPDAEDAAQTVFRRVMERADLVRFICPGYSGDCFQRRNQWMVDHSARVIAVCNGQPSGTQNTIDYARRCSVPVIFIPR